GKTSDESVRIRWYTVWYDYIETLNLEIVEGRSFSRKFPAVIGDEVNFQFIINEEAVKLMGVESAVGLNFELFGKKGPIIGVVKNFHYRPLQTKIEPFAMFILPFYNREILIKLRPENIDDSLAYIKKVWEKTVWALFGLNYPFEFSFVDQNYDKLYKTQERIGALLSCFALLTVFISCLGLLGLASFATERRTKEIGIRKVLGASVPGIVFMLSKEFVKWVLIANVIAWPIAYYAMNKWLQNFAYRIDMSIWLFVLAGLLALVIALLTVSF
ncbi:unnamed protein product, partial [marine sediment metagenome]